MVLSAVVWAYCKTREAVKQKEAIFLYKMEIYRLEKKPERMTPSRVHSCHPPAKHEYEFFYFLNTRSGYCTGFDRRHSDHVVNLRIVHELS